MEDVLAVLDAIGSERASIFGVSEGGGGVAALFAAMHPERTAGIVVYGTATASDHHHDALLASTGIADPLAGAEVWARQELEAVVEALASAYGVGGRARHVDNETERARKAFTRRMRDAMARIGRLHPTLGRHLDASVHTGLFCRYAPERPVAGTVSVR